MIRVVITTTTLPDRYDSLARMVRSLKAQTHPISAIYLGLPRIASRLQQTYGPLSEELSSMVTVVPMEVDYGPLSKLYSGVVMENDPETIIITVDDDVEYEPTLISDLVGWLTRYPKQAIGSSGILLGKGFPFLANVNNSHTNINHLTGFDLTAEGRSVDVLCGFSAVGYRRKFFNSSLFDYSLTNPSLFFNDDLLISGWLSSQKIVRRCVPGIPPPKLVVAGPDGLSKQPLVFLNRFRAAVEEAQTLGWYSNPENVEYSETIGGRIGIGLLILAVLAILIVSFQKITRTKNPSR